MTDKKPQAPEAPTELSQTQLDDAQGGFKNSDGILRNNNKKSGGLIGDQIGIPRTDKN